MNEDTRLAISDLVTTSEPAHLGPDRRAGTMEESEILAAVHKALPPGAGEGSHQQLLLALVLLWHDHLNASHVISQGIVTEDGSFVHAMMHRREPDYSNSKYWWRQAGPHPAFRELGRRAGEHLRTTRQVGLEQRLIRHGVWKPGAFVDACEAVADPTAADPEVRVLRELQRLEFRVFLDHLFCS
jgi:hypothetical protein